MAYQTFDDRQGDSNSERKLAKLKLPANLAGKRVLDLGCNEGFFSFEAKRRGAEYVLGIDVDPKAIAAATERAERTGTDVEFRVGRMEEAPHEKFDFILILSALHYIPDPARLLSDLRSRLNPGGTLILEVGVWPNETLRVGRAVRSVDERFFPTRELLRQVWLRDYLMAIIGPSVPQVGDPVPRQVLHCTPARTNVVFIQGKGATGKSSLSAQLGTHYPVVATDQIFTPARFGTEVPPAQKLYDQILGETHDDIQATWERIGSESDVKKYFAQIVADAIRHCRGAGVIVVEGFALTTLVPDIEANLGPEFHCWVMGPGKR